MDTRQQIDERNNRRHASHPEQWGWANTPDCSAIGKGHIRTLIEEIESQAATIARLTAERDEARAERLLLARACADTPQFNNPMDAMRALSIRDRVLTEALEQGHAQPTD